MVENGNAIALMGNHEYNALCFHYQETEGGHLHKHLIKNIIQHYEALKQFHNRQEEYEEYIDWFKTLPLFYETETFRAVHACWDIQSIQYLKTVLIDNKLNDDLIYQSVKKRTKLNLALEETLKGKEISIPQGFDFKDKDGAIRTEIRIKWWENPLERNYREISVEAMENFPAVPIDLSSVENIIFYQEIEKPVFFGLTG
ncbi:MAG: Calcineurin-like phosphoesterase [Segetibacter sp.]|nr:Calcineurin-like phosphoesterase [Segetibacter sp.]